MHRTPLAFPLLVLLALQRSCFAQLEVSTDFAGGSAVIVSVDTPSQSAHIQPEVHRDRGWPCWWYCRLDGLSVGKPVQVTVSANRAPFRSQEVLNHTWLLPDRAAISGDNITWKHSSQADKHDGSATYTFHADSETMWIAWGPPFLPTHAEALLRKIAAAVPDAKVFQLARTRGDRPVYGIRFGTPPAGSAKSSAIWIQARQHAWEAGSSWVAQGFLNWAASDDPIAVGLRNRTTICVVPIMDVDSVAGGKASVPRDHNRDWDDQPVYPEVRAAQAQIKQLHNSGRFDLFVDLHNPGPGDRNTAIAPNLNQVFESGLPKSMVDAKDSFQTDCPCTRFWNGMPYASAFNSKVSRRFSISR